MIGLLLITHYTYGESLIQSVHHVLNTVPPQLEQLGVMEKDDPLDLLPRAREVVKQLDSGNGVLVMTDMYGGSPANIAMKLLVPGRIEGLAGVNLPMLLRALTYRDKNMETLVMRATTGGRDGVVNMLKH